MNPARKRLRLTAPPDPPSPSHRPCPLLSQHALLQGMEEEEEEEGGDLLVQEDTTDSSQEESELQLKKRRGVRKRWSKASEGEGLGCAVGGASESDDRQEQVEIDRRLDQSLETKSRQHNLTTVNVKNIIHEVITNEHVVAMMKAAINETEAPPAFEPKMTRAKFKEVVERGVVIPTWNISPIKKSSEVNKAPQFMDIPLAEEDSSDEEYRPDEEDEDETAEDTFQESDMESTASSPRGSRLVRGEEDSCSPWQTSRRKSRFQRGSSISMGPPPPPKALPPKPVTDRTFLEKLHAVEEELAVCLEPYQPLSESEDEVGLMAYRTRSKRPLRDVPLGRLEAELRAPDITPDMYDSSSAHEDREWTHWLRSLMISEVDNEEECDDEDDPEYNFLADKDEPDLEDYRDDKAVRITKKEVNELMEELFETLKEDLAGQDVDDEGHEEEEEPQEETHAGTQRTAEETHNTVVHEDVDVGPVPELRTVKQQLSWIRNTHTLRDTHTLEPHTLRLEHKQKRRLQQQLQQHVQLLTQIHLLTSPVSKLHSEAETTRQFLVELEVLAHRAEVLMSSARPSFCSSFRSSNLRGALQLLEELRPRPLIPQSKPRPPDARGYMRVHPLLPAELAWIFCTRSVFLYPELLPCVSLDPALYCPRRTAAFTAAEDCLLVLGLRNMEGSRDPAKLVSQFLLRKTLAQVRCRILQCCRPGVPDNIVKTFRYQRVLQPMPLACRPVDPVERRPPLERDESCMPMWLVRSLPVIHPTIERYNAPPGTDPEAPPTNNLTRPRQSHYIFLRSASRTFSFPPGTRYPPRLPKHLDFRRIGFVVLQQPLPPAPPSDSAPPAPGSDITITSTVSLATAERIKGHYRTFASLRRRSQGEGGGVRRGLEMLTPLPPEVSAHCQEEAVEGDDVIRKTEEGEEEESEVLLTLSESSPSAAGSGSHDDDITDEEAESEREEEREEEEDDEGQRDEAFARDYLRRVCDAVRVVPGVSEQLLQVLTWFSDGAVSAHQGPEHLYERLSALLRPWPQLLRDFAAFLNPEQARRCGLLTEQQLFQRSRRFLWRLSRSLGEGSALYQQVVSSLQGSPALSPADRKKICSLLEKHPDLQELFQQLHAVTSLRDTPTSEESDTGSDGGEEGEEPNLRQEIVVWTREADRVILTACQRGGANKETFSQVSAHLGNRTAHQVSLRFRDLMSLFQKSTSCSSSRQEAAPD